MHWFWIDRFTVFESGKRADAIKAVTIAEDHLHQHFRHYAVMPASLMIEGVAQTAGLLIFQSMNYSGKIVLAKLPKMTFHELEARPGDLLTYSVAIDRMLGEGAMVSATIHNGGQLMAEGELVFAFLNENFADQSLFQDGDMVDMLRFYGVFRIGVDADGNKLQEP